ncbi:hypothetical protein [Polymorphobacter sp. PAMC 29334]|uniref:hypothetical protein n=1 Tax=Polymorphobacter sp. PAMC 29334 TaxID=2862331 RepID=UPI001D00F00D|nr:hypothetical protein [Polymorphobacter sp. PAMC 29334]
MSATTAEPRTLGQSILRWVGPLVSLAIVGVALNTFRGTDFHRIWALVPSSPLFWLVFVAAYLAQPTVDFIIFRRLWGIPPAGFPALVRKFISNEVLLGYSGEIYFYTWARRRATLDGDSAGAIRTGAPFGAIKDVAILSALIGNAVTLVMFSFAYSTLEKLNMGLSGKTLFTSIAVLLVSSLVVMLLRGRVFSMPRRDLIFVGTMQLIRVLGSATLLAVMWSLVLPTVPFIYWMMLTTLRLLISRLPLVPNKDVVFAGVAVLIVGTASGIAPLMAMMAGLLIIVHVAVGGVLVASDLLGLEKPA